VPAVRRWVTLLLVLAFAASAIFHVAGGAHAEFEASHLHESASMTHGAEGEPCLPGETGAAPQDTGCAMVSPCALCVPVTVSAVLPPLIVEPARPGPQAAYLGRIPSPQQRGGSERFRMDARFVDVQTAQPFVQVPHETGGSA
jgi:hypothetical protein